MKNIYRLIQGDCLKVLPKIQGESVDLIFADPPYNISSRKMLHTEWCGYTSEKGKWDYIENYEQWVKQWTRECYRILRNGGSFYIIGVFGSLLPVYQTLQSLGARFQTHIVWHKTNPAPCVNRRMYTFANEIILLFTKGNNWTFNYEISKTFNNGKQLHNVWDIPAVKKIEDITVKPEKLLQIIIAVSSNIGDVVLDPFLGSGTTMKVCQDLKRSCIGIEINSQYCEIVMNRCFGKTFLDRTVEYEYEVF